MSVLNFFKKEKLKYIKFTNFRIFDFAPGSSGSKFEDLLGDMILEGLKARGIPRQLIVDLRPDKDPRRITFNDIDVAVEFINLVSKLSGPGDKKWSELRRAYRNFDKAVSNGVSFDLDSTGVYRNNLIQLLYDSGEIRSLYFAPIMFAVCDIDLLSPVFASNLDEAFDDVPIASIVRASAGHPGRFRPKRVEVKGKERRFTDGGLTVNFPAGALLKDLSDRLRGGDSRALHKRFLFLRSQPYVALGLTTKDVPVKRRYLNDTLSLLLGGAKSQLEYQIASGYPYFRQIQQPMSGEPGILNFRAVNPGYIDSVVNRSSEFFQSARFSNESNVLDSDREQISLSVGAAIRSVSDALGGIECCRAHLFFHDPKYVGRMVKKAVFCEGRDANDQPDRELSFEREGGLIGLVAELRQPLLCKIDLLQADRYAEPSKRILGLTARDVRLVPRDLNFCFAFPIYDPRSLSFRPSKLSVKALGSLGRYLRVFDDGLDGSLLGVVSIDGIAAKALEPWSELERLVLDTKLIEDVERRMIEIGYACSNSLRSSVRGEPHAN